MELVKLDLIKKAIDEKKGEDIKIYDLTTSSPICSYMVVATILNGRHGKAIADAIQEIQEKLGQKVRHIEGGEKDSWILIDLNDIIVQLFTSEERNRVGLDQLIERAHHE